MSEKEKNEIAIITCNIIAESRNMDASIRIKEVNSAREKIGEDKFLENDEYIIMSYRLGICKELVLNDPNLEDKFIELTKQENKRLEDLLNEVKEINRTNKELNEQDNKRFKDLLNELKERERWYSIPQ